MPEKPRILEKGGGKVRVSVDFRRIFIIIIFFFSIKKYIRETS